MPIYNKLIRDRIPEIIAAAGQRATIRTLSDDEYRAELHAKLQEEVAEYLHDKNSSELADILEVIYALGQLHGDSPESLEALRKQKATERGGFEKKIYLINVEE